MQMQPRGVILHKKLFKFRNQNDFFAHPEIPRQNKADCPARKRISGPDFNSAFTAHKGQDNGKGFGKTIFKIQNRKIPCECPN
jgi:hypothetical protein